MQVTITHEIISGRKFGITEDDKVYRLPYQEDNRNYEAKRLKFHYHQGQYKYYLGQVRFTEKQIRSFKVKIDPYMIDVDEGMYIGDVFVMGKMSGAVNSVKRLFSGAENLLKELGANPISPLKLNHIEPLENWDDFVIEDISELLKCDGVFMLEGWKEDRNSRIVHAIAKELNFNIYYNE